MNGLINLGLNIGVEMGFTLWCILFIVLSLAIIYLGNNRSREAALKFIRTAARFFEPGAKRLALLFPGVAGGEQGLPVQLEIFEQHLVVRIRVRLRELINSLKIHR